MFLHVDDLIFAGNQRFIDTVIKPLKSKYEISKHEEQTFRYIGINICQSNFGITFDQEAYLECIEPVKLTSQRRCRTDEPLTAKEHTQFLSLLGKISWLAQITRPELKFDVYLASKCNKSPTVQNLLDLNSVVTKAKKLHRRMLFTRLDGSKNWKLAVFADASFANLDGKVNSARGYLVLLCDGDHGCVLTWNTNKVSRVVTSVLESETLAIRDGVRHAELLRSILCILLYKSDGDTGILPIIAFTDSNQLWNSVHSSKRCSDVALYRDICCIQEKIKDGILSELRWVSNDEQMADCLTKRGAGVQKLCLLTETGVLKV